jgi:hypothetical protein
VQFDRLFLQNRCAQNATGVPNHERHSFRRRLAGGHDQVAFILAVVVVHHHDHFALTDGGKSLFDGIECVGCVVVAHGSLLGPNRGSRLAQPYMCKQ